MRLARHDARDAIVEPVHDVAVMHQEIVRDFAETLLRLLIGDALRLVAAVAGGQHNRAVEILEQKVMQRRIGKHEAERRLAGRDAASQRSRCCRLRLQDRNRRPHPLEQSLPGLA